VLVSVVLLTIVEPAASDRILVEAVPNIIFPEITPSLRIPPVMVLLEEILMAATAPEIVPPTLLTTPPLTSAYSFK